MTEEKQEEIHVTELPREERLKIARGAFGMWKDMDFEQDPNEPIVLSRVGPGDGWWPDALAGVIALQQDEDGSYIVSEEKTIIYGHGETSLEALRDYIISMIEYVQLLLPKTINKSV